MRRLITVVKLNLKVILKFTTLFFVALTSCVDRQWNNPFDPYCPEELFTPDSFTATQQGTSIRLTWNQANDKISGFKILRQLENGSMIELETLSKETFFYIDPNIIGGKNYTYILVAIAGTYASNKKTVSITPVLGATLTTAAVSSITTTTATSGGNISSDGGASVTDRGICFGTTQSPTIAGIKVPGGTGTGSFISTLANLLPNTTYYVRAFATNSTGTSYGNQVSFTTPTSVPTVTTVNVTVFNSTSANLGGVVTSDGGLTVTERGVCYSTSQNPTTANSKIIIGNGTGNFSTTVSNLTVNTTYFVRAYAINSKGTAYGNQVSFKTDNPLTDVDGNPYKTVIIGNQVWMAENLKATKYSNGTAIPNVTDYATWAGLTSGAYCYFLNNASLGSIYGGLYNFYAVIDSRGLCPTGWHVPSDSEWSTMRDYLGGEIVAGGKLKETGTVHWASTNSGVDNSTEFTALGGSWRGNDGLFYYYLGHAGWWWTSTAYDATYAWLYFISNSGTGLGRTVDPYFKKEGGCSVRCIKN